MPKLIAIVDQRPELLEFLREKIAERGYEVIAVRTEEEADDLDPAPDVIVLDFEKFGVDLEDVFKLIEESLQGV